MGVPTPDEIAQPGGGVLSELIAPPLVAFGLVSWIVIVPPAATDIGVLDWGQGGEL
jgi:hypothetical protein